jgi:nucleotide-binding universal stress UspA family protein
MELASRVGESIAAPVGSAPVLLATLGVPFDPEAARVAVDSAVESGQPLIVANVVELPFLPTSVILGYDQIDDPELSASVLAPAELAHSLGVRVERLRVKSPRPLEALLELVVERDPSFLVFGPDRTRLRRRRYRKAAKAVREQAPCLVWLPE